MLARCVKLLYSDEILRPRYECCSLLFRICRRLAGAMSLSLGGVWPVRVCCRRRAALAYRSIPGRLLCRNGSCMPGVLGQSRRVPRGRRCSRPLTVNCLREHRTAMRGVWAVLFDALPSARHRRHTVRRTCMPNECSVRPGGAAADLAGLPYANAASRAEFQPLSS